MTILPKKKTSQSKNDQSEGERENVGTVSSHQIAQPNENRYNHTPNSRNSPPRGWGGSDHDAHHEVEVSANGVSNAVSAGVNSSHVGNTPNTSHKRQRHRASPHRNGPPRKHRDIRNSTSSCATSSAVITSAPSTSTNVVGVGGSTLSSSNTSTSTSCVGQQVNPADSQDIDEDYSGYNSGDEYMRNASHVNCRSAEEWSEVERIFEKKLRKKGFTIKMMNEDGACLFRAVADQVYGDQEMHHIVRKHCMDYMAKNSDYFSQYVTEDFDKYVKRKRLNHIHGNHLEMQAMCEMFNRSIEVFHYTTDAINTFHSAHSTDNEPIRISYHKMAHYNSIVDPFKATVGVGLGLPGMMPGLADKNLMSDAVKQSEDFHIEQAMLEDKLKATDWEATSEAIEEQVARESYLQWLRDNERRHHKASTRSATATCSSVSAEDMLSPRGRLSPSGGNSPSRASSSYDLHGAQSSSSGAPLIGSPVRSETLSNSALSVDVASSSAAQSFDVVETSSIMHQLPPDVFGLSEWEDAGILAQVLAVSQQEYLDSLRRKADSGLRADEAASTSRINQREEQMMDTEADQMSSSTNNTCSSSSSNNNDMGSGS